MVNGMIARSRHPRQPPFLRSPVPGMRISTRLLRRQTERHDVCAGCHRDVLLPIKFVAYGRGSPALVCLEAP
jgi:hypothetical protein